MNLVVVLVDSLRHDALGCTQRPSPAGAASPVPDPYRLSVPVHTPTIDALAAQGWLWDRMVAAAPWTVPAVASLLTGVHSHRLGLAKWEQPWPADYPSLFHLAADAGSEVASFVFDPTFMFRRVPEAAVRDSSQDTEAVLEWFRQPRSAPFVAFVHYWWTHIPYVAKPMSNAVWRKLSNRVLATLRTGTATRAGVEGLYAHAVEHFSEQWLPRLLEVVDLDSTWLVITADHGDSWGERAETADLKGVFDLHGNTLYEQVLRVPLLIRPPGSVAARRFRELIRAVDLMPTLAALLGWSHEPLPADLDGEDLSDCLLSSGPLPALDAISVMNRDVVAAAALPEQPVDLYEGLALTTARTKQIWEPRSDRRQAFDLVADPGETSDISAGARAAELAPGWRRLEQELARARVGDWLEADAEQMRRRLRRLGYLE